MSHFRRSLSLLSLLGGAVALTGCAMGNFTSVDKSVPNNVAIHGTAMGGQQPIAGAKISVYAVGTGGYGTAGTLLASTTTNANGGFSFPAGTYTCPQSNTPVYLIGTGGDAGYGTNAAAVTAAPLGSCQNAPNEFVVMNEVTTVALGYALSNYFTTSLGAGTGTPDTYDTFGGPSTLDTSNNTVYANGITLGNSYTAGLIAINGNGLAYANNGIITAEPLKVYSIANTLAACINSAGGVAGDGSACGTLFTNTTPPGGVPPSDTLQAVVQMALYPYQNVTTLYNLAGTKPPFNADLASAPPDWSVAVSYTSASLGLGVDTNTLSTVDVDGSNRVWFPSTASGAKGIAYFDPTTSAFSGPFNGTNMVHPQQVAIDGSGYVWVTDTQGNYLSGYNTASPNSYSTFGIISGGTTSTTKGYSLSVASDNTVHVGLLDSTLGVYKLATLNAARNSFTEDGVTMPTGRVPFSLTTDGANNLFMSLSSGSSSVIFDYLPTGTTTLSQRTTDNTTDAPGQVAFNGYDLFGIRAYDNNSAHLADGMCFAGEAVNGVIDTAQGCYLLARSKVYDLPQGMSVDGIGSLWLADENNATVQQITFFDFANHKYTQSTRNGTTITSFTYNHNSSNGGTMTNPEGVGVDNEGNVWVSNAGCMGTGCTPGSFVMTEIIGTGAPTITPVAAQIQNGNSPSALPQY